MAICQTDVLDANLRENRMWENEYGTAYVNKTINSL